MDELERLRLANAGLRKEVKLQKHLVRELRAELASNRVMYGRLHYAAQQGMIAAMIRSRLNAELATLNERDIREQESKEAECHRRMLRTLEEMGK